MEANKKSKWNILRIMLGISLLGIAIWGILFYVQTAGSDTTDEEALLIPLLDNNTGKWGFADREMNEIIPCRYDHVQTYENGMAAVKFNKRWGFVDENGKEIVPCKYTSVHNFSEGLAAISVGDWETGKWGFIDKEGNEIIPCKYYMVESFSDGMAAVSKGKYPNEKWGFVDNTGKEVIPCKYDCV